MLTYFYVLSIFVANQSSTNQCELINKGMNHIVTVMVSGS